MLITVSELIHCLITLLIMAITTSRNRQPLLRTYRTHWVTRAITALVETATQLHRQAVTAMPQERYRVMTMRPVIPEVTAMLRALSAVTRMQGRLEVTAMPPAL